MWLDGARIRARGLRGSAATRGRRLRRDARQRRSRRFASQHLLQDRAVRRADRHAERPTRPRGSRVLFFLGLRHRVGRRRRLRRGGLDVGPVAQRRSREMPGGRVLLRARDDRDGRVRRPSRRVHAFRRPGRHRRVVRDERRRGLPRRSRRFRCERVSGTARFKHTSNSRGVPTSLKVVVLHEPLASNGRLSAVGTERATSLVSSAQHAAKPHRVLPRERR